MPRFVLDDTSRPVGPDEDPAGPVPEPRAPFMQRWGVVLAVLALLGALLAGLGWYASIWKQQVWVREVVVSGVSLLDAGELKAYAGDLADRPLQDVDTEELRRRYVSHPYIRSASVTRELNGIVRVHVEERQPLCRLVTDGGVRMIDTEGVVLPVRREVAVPGRLIEVTGLPVKPAGIGRPATVSGELFEVFNDVLDALRQTAYAGLLVRRITLIDGNKTYFTVAGSQTRFVVGNDGNYKEKLKKFEIFWQKVVSRKGFDSYSSVDLRFHDRVFARENE
ncbi:FtsQ-type POTRA domain-containing protein [Prosthecochloris sp. N3]|uniref:FtsQ-type POTRA domain-containing protein n=1 Tax=Prosthecochloris ethylica TaxID=2743976 RepID=A0ABR9XR49_9CHLB|nr:FtsQ-type POTRA domain-containing protein [Prosthecochloris ethylica]MBF0586104.1 FtsQ-type POTRA domain-containing protein [Prosthecochloris ethylica]MBF0636496.1 FtsQ-type POTRA domain-containing protein [Prosthecochloris ethylica]MEC9486381.1 FtsQ-type POTRA domain-containing protein [Prosthecochloris sp.]NUK47128.1 FtsQ-type POTRA domain-containing protein [Prosthecochloris ethylica]